MTSSKPESKPINSIRKLIVVLIVSFFIIFGLPLYHGTTSIYRAELPIQEIENLSNTLKDHIHFKIPIYLNIPNTLNDFTSRSQKLIDDNLNELHPQFNKFWNIELKNELNDHKSNENYIVNFEPLPMQEKTDFYFISPFNREITLYVTEQTIKLDKIDEFLATIITEQLFNKEIDEFLSIYNCDHETNKKTLAVPYSSKYDVVFSLFVEGGKSVNWEIEEALNLLTPILEKMTHYSNISITSQVQYYSKLSNTPRFDSTLDSYIIEEAELPSFIDYGDWNLITNNINPTINFILYFPNSYFEGKDLIISNSKSNSFLIPQWGGVHIFNRKLPYSKENDIFIDESELAPILEIFTSQLFQLLGLSNSPKSPIVRIDSLSRLSIFKNLRKSLDNLNSLIKLTHSLSEISIPDLTKNYVVEAVGFIDKSISELTKQNHSNSVKFAARALENSDKAFFEKEMVQQAYFPSEHKLAVFLPLLGPMMCILSLGFIKTISDWKNEKNLKKQKQD